MAEQPDLAVTVRDEIANSGATNLLNDKLVAAFVDRSKWVTTQLHRLAAAD